MTGSASCGSCGVAREHPAEQETRETLEPARWWVATPAADPAGPFDYEQIGGLVREGTVTPATQLCRESDSVWAPAVRVMPERFGWYAEAPRSTPGYVDINLNMILTFLFGVIWFLIWLYPRMVGYRDRSGRPGSRSVVYFWSYVGVIVLAIVSSPLQVDAILVLCWLGTTVLGGLLMYEVVTDRDNYAASLGVLPQLQRRDVIVAVVVLANAVCLLIGGIILLLPAYMLFQDQNRIVQAAQNQGEPWT